MSTEPVTALAEVQPQAIAKSEGPLSLGELKNQVQLVQQFMRGVMTEGQHYGKIPGCGDKPSLFKSGAEKLAFAFHLVPTFRISERQLDGGHREYQIVATIATSSGEVVAEGVGSCSTMEAKYRYRQGQRKCPKCKAEAIIKGKAEFGGGWLCFSKRGGCGAKWADGAKEIEGQHADRVENQDIADQYNTVLKMAKKRAFVDATITATATSDIFTQDIEETHSQEDHAPAAPTASAPAAAPVAAPVAPAPPPAAPKAAPPPKAAHPPKPAQHPVPADPNENEIGTAVREVLVKTGTKKDGQPWTLFTIRTDDGFFKTFDKKLGATAEKARDNQSIALIKWRAGGRDGGDRDVVSIDTIDGGGEEAAG